MRTIRIVLLIANGGWLLILVVGVVLADIKWSVPIAILLVVFSFIMAGNFAYIWRFPPRKKWASDRSPAPHG
jgi:uncharacterized membrane protein (DUF485 family)